MDCTDDGVGFQGDRARGQPTRTQRRALDRLHPDPGQEGRRPAGAHDVGRHGPKPQASERAADVEASTPVHLLIQTRKASNRRETELIDGR